MTKDYEYLAQLYNAIQQNDLLFMAVNYHWVIGCDVLENAFGEYVDLKVIKENEEFELFGIKGTVDIDCPNRVAIFKNYTDELFMKIKQMQYVKDWMENAEEDTE